MGGMRSHSLGKHLLMTVFKENVNTANMITTTNGGALVTTPITAIKNIPVIIVMPVAEKCLICC
jgi:3-hydroxyisobutyrate dehydrogenase-like beta-hydroxyacid dehydrogenase